MLDLTITDKIIITQKDISALTVSEYDKITIVLKGVGKFHIKLKSDKASSLKKQREEKKWKRIEYLQVSIRHDRLIDLVDFCKIIYFDEID